MTRRPNAASCSRVFLFFDHADKQFYLGAVGGRDPLLLPQQQNFDADARALHLHGIDGYTHAAWARPSASLDVGCFDEVHGHVRFASGRKIRSALGGSDKYLEGFAYTCGGWRQYDDLPRFGIVDSKDEVHPADREARQRNG